ncbi:MAG TPA: ComEC/Rec2 family competence protein [Egibacteraceae bacterium]|nr:ComEC/Rec2 family competence protein [Egibacteraceae bacterium]
MSTASAWVLVGALWAGCLTPGSWRLALVGSASLLAAAAIARVAAWRRRPAAGVALLAGAAVGFLLLGAGLAGGRVEIRDGGLLPKLAERGGSAALEAVAVTEPRETPGGVWLILRVTSVDGAPTRERALLRLDERQDVPEIGERLGVIATARPLGTEGFDAHVRRLHAAVALDAGRLERTGPPGRVLRATTVIRERSRAAFDLRLAADSASLLSGLVLGDARGRSEQRAEQFKAAGLTHLVVVSGRHVAVLLAGVLALSSLLGAGARARRWIALASLAWFVVLVRWQPSVLRAGAMASLVLGAGLLGRGRDARHALAMAVLVLLLVDPLLAGQLGFGLSVTATAGVLVLAPVIAARLPGPKALRLPLAVTLGAQLGAAPLLFQLQGGIPLAAIPANLLAVPAAGLAQTIGLIAGLVSQVSVPAGGGVAAAARPPLAVVRWAAETFSTGPLLRLSDVLAPATALLAGALLLRRRAPRMALAALAACVALSVWPVAPLPGAGSGVAELTVLALDVGQGDAILVEVPGTPPARMLVDAGPDAAQVADLLTRRGIDRLDALVLSHPHHDHSGGVAAVIERLDVAAIVVGPTPLAPSGDIAPSALDSYAAAQAHGIAIVPVSGGQRFSLGTATVEVLSPPADGALAHDLNENSVVLRVAGAHGSVLLTGDAELAAQSLLLRRPERLRSSVVKIPHHGGNTNAPGFLEAVGAEVALISAGVDNDYGHPHPDVLDGLRDTRVLRTDADGTVGVTLGPGGPRVIAAGEERSRRPRYTAAHDGAPWDVPADGAGGAAPAARRRQDPRRAARSRRARGGGSSGRRPARRRTA